MSMLKCGIVGLPNVGKSTLFNALTACQAASSNYPFCTIDPNVGVVDVIDPRLQVLSDLSKSKKLIYASMQFVDIAGLVEGASKGEGLGNKFLANIRETDAIVHVVRCFESEDITHVSGSVDPIRDIEVINLELVLADLQSVESIVVKLEKQSKGNKELLPTIDVLKRIRDHLNEGQPVRTLEFTKEEEECLKPYPFLSSKKVLYVANIAESELPGTDHPLVQKVREFAEAEGNSVITISCEVEQQIAQLEEVEQKEFLESLELDESGLQKLVKASFKMLGLITYLTTGEIETRAWTIREGTNAQLSAGEIHTDIQKGFIRAEVVKFDDMVEFGSRAAAREAGKVRAEGKEYIVEDGDVILFMHN